MLDSNNDGVAILSLENAKPNDFGIYSFTQQFSNTFVLEWENPQNEQFLIEYCKLGSGEWTSSNAPISGNSFTIDNLVAGQTYSFRLVSYQTMAVSLPTLAVTLPVADTLLWQQEHFKRRYIELEEISRGKFSVVRLAKDRAERGDYLEDDVKLYTSQLISALAWLHRKDLVHLDIKPENVMADTSFSPPLLKLVDFGDSVNTSKNVILPPACLEFASPEFV
ncbi:unnamed protein product [Ceutorhynchus assimilis]|uniref:Protein kinase domain-containing protein n=1 Tax=Ceutorhynchus assimilis TaxID=467358 RepID=A0A9N9MY30_9CUCU|nr:unnamed protein product [Ceutorhynchus assimilis]